MKSVDTRALTISQLVYRFTEIGIAQDQALFDDEYGKYNKLYVLMDGVDNELRARGPEARLALSQLYDHPNMQVRLKAAVRTLSVAPDSARQVLENIAKSGWYPQAGDAGMILSGLDDGSFKPD